MSGVPVVAIVGRPNVGKSSLFNMLAGQRLSIEDPTAGVTRDRLLLRTEVAGRSLDIVDTGGLGLKDAQNLEEDVEEQAEFAIAGSDLVIFLVDGSHLVTELDRDVAKRLHQAGIPCLLVANKVDNAELAPEAQRFRALGFGPPVIVSVLHRRGIEELEAGLGKRLPPAVQEAEVEKAGLRISLAGRRNVGKSSLVNLLCGQKRVIVSAVPGTTRDAVDVAIRHKGKNYVLVDTAGLRKKSQLQDGVEFYSMSRTYGAMTRSGLVLMMIDAAEGVGSVDRKLADWIIENNKPCVLVVNKWDLAGESTPQEYEAYVRKRLTGMGHVPVAVISAQEKTGMDKLFALVEQISAQMARPAPTTHQINQILQRAQNQRAPSASARGTPPKLFYATQLSDVVPSFIIFGHKVADIRDDYRRYLSRALRRELGIDLLPVRLVFKERPRREAPAGSRLS